MKKLTVLLVVTAFLITLINGFTQEAKKAAASKFNYIGVAKCKMCHKGEKKGNIFEKWEAESHSKAFATLATDQAKQVATKAGVKGDPQQAAECLVCHTTGYKAAAAQKEATLTMEEGVSCESCHGPGSEYKSMKVMKDITAGTAKGGDFGLVVPDETVCKSCHNPKSPTYKEFKFAEAVKKVAHPLPQK